jgi:branched-chain amino acid transport system ATP-binding protein
MLKIKGLHSKYGELKVLRGVDLQVKRSEIVSLIGPNGAGKSTVLKTIFGIATLSSGKIIFEGKDLTGKKTHELLKHGISYVPQGRTNFTNLTVKENLMLGYQHNVEGKGLEQSLQSVYKKFPELKKKEKQLAYSLSGGEQQMLAIGRTLMQQPKLLLLDEPSLGLSPLLQKELFTTLTSLRDEKGISILLVEQNAKKAIEVSDRTIVLEDGKVALEGRKSEITKSPMIKRIYLGGK